MPPTGENVHQLALIELTSEGAWDLLQNPIFLVSTLFVLWMFVDAIRRQEFIWAIFMFFGLHFTAVLYFFLVYRGTFTATRGFELPGATDRRRIRHLQAQIHHLDKAHHHLQLGDIYFQRGKLAKAESCYRASIERDGTDLDAVAHLGQCLLRQKRPDQARPLLQRVCTENVKHDYGHTLMAYAECLGALGEKPEAIQVWEHVLREHSYARARVQVGELYLEQGNTAKSREELLEVISDDLHAPAFQRKRDRVWVRRARRMLRRAQ